jgi:hypothetical protein
LSAVAAAAAATDGGGGGFGPQGGLMSQQQWQRRLALQQQQQQDVLQQQQQQQEQVAPLNWMGVLGSLQPPMQALPFQHPTLVPAAGPPGMGGEGSFSHYLAPGALQPAVGGGSVAHGSSSASISGGGGGLLPGGLHVAGHLPLPNQQLLGSVPLGLPESGAGVGPMPNFAAGGMLVGESSMGAVPGPSSALESVAGGVGAVVAGSGSSSQSSNSGGLTSGSADGAHISLGSADVATCGWLGSAPAHVPATDLERFIAGVTPCLYCDPGLSASQLSAALRLGDVWQMFKDASLWGAPVVTLGGARGCSTAYYVPYLSAMQLFTTVAPVGAADGADGAPGVSGSKRSSSSSGGGSGMSDSENSLLLRMGTTSNNSARSSTSNSSSGGGGGSSGVQSGATASSTAGGGSGTGRQVATGPGPGVKGQMYATTVDSWPERMKLLVQHVEVELPFSREPLFIQMESMSREPQQQQQQQRSPVGGGGWGGPPGSRGGYGQPLEVRVGPELQSTLLADMHPASWFAVAWYPVYRIPDAPLTARFLSFYSFAQLLQVLRSQQEQEQGAGVGPGNGTQQGQPSQQQQQQGTAAGRPPLVLQLPVVGIKWYNQMAERWQDVLVDQGSGSHMSSSPAAAAAAHPEALSVTQVRDPPGRQMERHALLEELQATAESLARCRGLLVEGADGQLSPAKLYHNDFEFFHVRSG